MPRPVLLGASFAVGIIAGILGTALHGNIWVIGDVESGLVLPWGALLSLLLLTGVAFAREADMSAYSAERVVIRNGEVTNKAMGARPKEQILDLL